MCCSAQTFCPHNSCFFMGISNQSTETLALPRPISKSLMANSVVENSFEIH